MQFVICIFFFINFLVSWKTVTGHCLQSLFQPLVSSPILIFFFPNRERGFSAGSFILFAYFPNMVSKKNLPHHLPFCLMARGGHNNCAILFQWSDRSSAIIYSFYSKYFFLLVPQFLFNLQSISTLTLAYYCSVNFFSKSCVIQDHSQGKIIGMGQMHANLYILEFNLPSVFSEFYNPSATCNNVTLPQNEIWHYHLGHPSHVKLHTL